MSSLTSPRRASRAVLHSQHHADCILPILVSWLAVGLIPARLPQPILDVSVASMESEDRSSTFPTWTSLPCILSQNRVRYLCAVTRLMDASFKFSLFFSIHVFLDICHPFMSPIIEPLSWYSSHSLYQLVVFVCWCDSRVTRCLRTCFSTDPHLIAFWGCSPQFHVDIWFL